MNLRSLSVRDRRALAIGGTAFVPMLLWLLVIAPFARHLDQARAQLDRSRDLLQRERRIVGSAAVYASARADATQRLTETRRRLIYATTEASASAMLAAFVDERARASGVEVNTVDAMRDSSRSGALQRISVRLAGAGDMEGILTLIGTLESGSPFLVITELQIEQSGQDPVTEPGPAITIGGALPTPAVATPEGLAFRLVVSGFRASAEPDSSAKSAANRVASR
jgi:type II secretory pathway component PulM